MEILWFTYSVLLMMLSHAYVCLNMGSGSFKPHGFVNYELCLA